MFSFDHFDHLAANPEFINRIELEPGVRLHLRPGIVSSARAIDFLMTLSKELLISEGLIAADLSIPILTYSTEGYPRFESKEELVAALIREVELVPASRYDIIRIHWNKDGTERTEIQLTDRADRFLVSYPKGYTLLDLQSLTLPKAPQAN